MSCITHIILFFLNTLLQIHIVIIITLSNIFNIFIILPALNIFQINHFLFLRIFLLFNVKPANITKLSNTIKINYSTRLILKNDILPALQVILQVFYFGSELIPTNYCGRINQIGRWSWIQGRLDRLDVPQALSKIR